MNLYKVGQCDYCGDKNEALRPSPFMADSGCMCEQCWDMTQKEYRNATGEFIPDFQSNKEEYNGIKVLKEQSGEDTEVRVDGQVIIEFDDYIEVDHVNDYIDFVTPNLIGM